MLKKLLFVVFLLSFVFCKERDLEAKKKDTPVASVEEESFSSNSKGALYYKTYCSSCHAFRGVKNAPPMAMVVMVYKRNYPEKKVFVDRLVNWVRNPKEEDSLLCGCVVRRFGLMPPLKLPRKTLEEIASFLWEEVKMPMMGGGMMGGMMGGGMMMQRKGGHSMCGGRMEKMMCGE